MTPAESGKRPPGNQVPVSGRTHAAIGVDAHPVDYSIGAPHACFARLEQAPMVEYRCDCEACS